MITTQVLLQTRQRYRAITKAVCPSYSDIVLQKSTMSLVYSKASIIARIYLGEYLLCYIERIWNILKWLYLETLVRALVCVWEFVSVRLGFVSECSFHSMPWERFKLQGAQTVPVYLFTKQMLTFIGGFAYVLVWMQVCVSMSDDLWQYKTFCADQALLIKKLLF